MVKQRNLLYRMLFLLHLLLSAVLEVPFDNVGLGRDTFDMLTLVDLSPELVEFLKLNQMPDLGQRGGNYGRLCNGGRGGDPARHAEAYARTIKLKVLSL